MKGNMQDVDTMSVFLQADMQLPSLDADSDSRSASGAGIPAHVGGDDVSSLSGYRCHIRSGTGLLSLCWINQ